MHNKGRLSHQALSSNYRAADTPHSKEKQVTARVTKTGKNRGRVKKVPKQDKFWHRQGPPNP